MDFPDFSARWSSRCISLCCVILTPLRYVLRDDEYICALGTHREEHMTPRFSKLDLMT
jgi:hypothetical protein